MSRVESLKPGAQFLWAQALEAPDRFGHKVTGLNHFLLALLERHGAMAESLASGLNASEYRRQIETRLQDGQIGEAVEPEKLLEAALRRAKDAGEERASEQHLAAVLLQEAGWTPPAEEATVTPGQEHAGAASDGDLKEKTDGGEQPPAEDRHGPDEPTQSQAARTKERVIRVFVSSTFRDMQAERDELVKVAFPELRQRCEGRGVVWGEVDLRWGIDEEQDADVLPRCLEEITDCRPFFIGLLGDRYGTVADLGPYSDPADDSAMADLLRREPWLTDQTGVSFTEIEVLHGVLRDPEAAPYARFYFRDATPAEDGRERALKEAISSQGLRWRPYAAPEELGRLVVDDLWELVEELFPEDSQPDALGIERAYHEAVAASLVPRVTAGGRTAGVYVARAADFASIDDHIAGSDPPLAVTGPPGAGKSALLANWTAKFADAHPEEAVISHYVGASPDSTDWMGTVRRLVGELQQYLGVEGDTPNDPTELRTAFADMMRRAADHGGAVIVLDGLDQLEDREGARDLVWLPTPPTEIRMIIATRPGRPLDEIVERSWPVLEVTPLDEGERRYLIDRYLDWWGKRLNEERVGRIAAAPSCSNPLFLSAVLNELRLFGGVVEFDKKMDDYLAATSIGELFDRILKRYENDYDRKRPRLVRDALTALAAARRGLTEAELIDVLGLDGEPLPHERWSPLHLAARPYLVDRSGLLGFAHPEFRSAVERNYEARMREAHLILADYFEQRDPYDSRRVEELPAQLAGAEAWPRLYALLADDDYQFVAGLTRPHDVERFWAVIESRSSFRRVDAFSQLIESLDDDVDRSMPELTQIMQVGSLLARAGHHTEALRVRRYLVDYYNQAGQPALMHWALNDLALSHRALGDYEQALAALRLRQRIELVHKVPDGERPKTLNNLGMVLGDLGRWEDALGVHRAQEQLAIEIGDERFLGGAYGNQARVLQKLGRLEEALRLLEQQERICRSQDDLEGLSHSLGNQGSILIQLGRLDRARDRIDEHEEISAELGDRAGLAMCALGRAALAFEAGDVETAGMLLDKVEDICQETGNPEALRLGAVSLRSALRRHEDEDALQHETTTRAQEEETLRLKGKQREADMDYGEFTVKFAKAFEMGDSQKTWDLLQQRIVCPKCENLVSPDMGYIESTKDMFVRCPECKATWIWSQ